MSSSSSRSITGKTVAQYFLGFSFGHGVVEGCPGLVELPKDRFHFGGCRAVGIFWFGGLGMEPTHQSKKAQERWAMLGLRLRSGFGSHHLAAFPVQKRMAGAHGHPDHLAGECLQGDAACLRGVAWNGAFHSAYSVSRAPG